MARGSQGAFRARRQESHGLRLRSDAGRQAPVFRRAKRGSSPQCPGSPPMNVVNRAERAFFRLELADALRSRWLSFIVLVYGVVFGTFIWLGLRESSVLGFTGLSRVVLNVSNAVVVVLPLVALVATTQTIV